MSHEEQSDPAGRSLVKRRQESEPALISLCNFFVSASSEQSQMLLVEKLERREKCQSIMFDEERLEPHVACVSKKAHEGNETASECEK